MAFGRAKKKPEPLNESGLYDFAVKALGRQMRSESELRRLMSGRAEKGVEGEAVIARVVARLREYGTWTISPLPRLMRACGSRTRSWASGG